MPKVKPREFDTILCFGFFYHTIRQIELIREIKRIEPKFFILDTAVAMGSTKLVHIIDVLTRIRFKHILEINKSLKILKARRGVGYLIFEQENHKGEAATIDSMDLVAFPTKSLVETLLKSYGFTYKLLHWNKKEIKTWITMEDYKTGRRVSYIAQPL